MHEVLFKYWGYNNFRPQQEEIIQSLLDGHDTLALLPTGGGKSICFQVPAMMLPGLCLVISPLIALMKDQVENLHKKGIQAAAIFSGMHYREIDRILEDAMEGQLKLLYISPERIGTEAFKLRLSKLKLSFIAVDEAHCISQWGYDFRPNYLKIGEIRELLSDIKIMALTATATPDVADDIEEKLGFKNSNRFVKSFVRYNLAYVLAYEDDKMRKMLDIFQRVPGTGIVYVRNRRRTQEMADYLRKNEVSADYYHAGLESPVRDRKQKEWTSGRTRVMVCTNAFGMGIDKPDVRTVVHMDLPENPESYFQEAGRAGRDEKKAYAVLLYNEYDKKDALNRFEEGNPSAEEVTQIYHLLGNYLNIATGSGQWESFDFDIAHFASQSGKSALRILNALKVLEEGEWMQLSEGISQPSRLMIYAGKDQLYKLQVDSPQYEPFIKFILRTYPGVLDQYVSINESLIATKLKSNVPDVKKALDILGKHEYLHYIAYSDSPKIIYIRPRVGTQHFSLDAKRMELRRKIKKKQLDAMLHYAEERSICRTVTLVEYFGEKLEKTCGICDVCLQRKKLGLEGADYDTLSAAIIQRLKEAPLSIQQLVKVLIPNDESKVLHTIEWLVECGEIGQNEQFKLEWKRK